MNIFIRMRSGVEHVIPYPITDIAGPSKELYEQFSSNKITVLKVNNAIFFVREIESIEFIE